MKPKPNLSRTFDEYLYALDEFYFKPKNINLYIGTKNNLLYPNLKVYDWDN
jgi:hypothetical protein